MIKEIIQDAKTIINVDKLDHLEIGKPLNKKRKINKKVLIIIFIIILICLIVFGLYFLIKYLIYKSMTNQGLMHFKSTNMMEAAPQFHLAVSFAIDKDEKIYAEYYEAECYFTDYYVLGKQSGIEDTTKIKDIFNTIINDSSYRDSKYYYNAVADMCLIYYYENTSADNSNWNNLIKILYSYTDILYKEIEENRNNHNNMISWENAVHISKIYLALFYYHMESYNEASMDLEYYPLQNAIYCGHMVIDIKKLISNTIDCSYLFFDDNIEIDYALMILNGITSLDNKDEALSDVIPHIENKIYDLQHKQVSTKLIYRYKYTLSRLYMLKSVISTDAEERAQYKEFTSESMHELLYETPDGALTDQDLVNVALYMISLDLTNPQDTPHITAKFLSYLISCNEQVVDKKEIISDILNMSRGCGQLLEKNGYSEAVFKNGKYLYDIVVSNIELLDSSYDNYLEYTKNFFATESEYYREHYTSD